MIKAIRAYQESKFRSKVTKVLDAIEEEIKKAIDKGEFFCNVDIATETEQEVRNMIKEELEQLGYNYTIPNFEKKPFNIPADQWKWYDTITVSWGDKK